MTIQVIGHFSANTQIINLQHEGSTNLMQCHWEFVGKLFTYQKPPFKNLCNQQFSHKLRRCEFLFDGPLHILWISWEVEIDMNGQSNDCLRMCNVKMKKKIYWGGNAAQILEILQVMAYSVKQFEFFFQKW